MTFGAVQKPLFPERTQVYFDSSEAIKRVHDRLTADNFTEDDFIILNGDPVLIAFVTAIAADYTDGRLKVLKFDRRENTYVPIEINDIFQREGGEDEGDE